MVNQIKNILAFLIIFLIVGEVFVRLKNSVSDIPQRTIDENGIQKYFPNQTGTWKGGTHTWNINDLGWPGNLPDSYDNLITIIGDSFIENFMNPNECHQAVYLKSNLSGYNFLEAGRSGVSFIESLEISKELVSFKPKDNLIYVKDSDFYQSIVELLPSDDITQYSLESDTVVPGKMKSPGLKKILYNWKFAYFLYNKSATLRSSLFGKEINYTKTFKDNQEAYNKRVFEFLERIKDKYDVENITLVFHPKSQQIIIDKCKAVGFDVLPLVSKDYKTWSFENDHHWTCNGHKNAARQIADYLKLKYN